MKKEDNLPLPKYPPIKSKRRGMYRLENYSPLLRNMHFRTLPYNIIEENHYYVPNPTKNFMCILPGHLMNLLHVKNIEKMANMWS